MNDSLPMRLVQGIRDLDAVAQRLLERQRAFDQSIRQRLALQVLHDEVLGLAFPSHVIERAYVRVRELRDGFCLPLEALSHLRGREMLRQDLDRHGPVQTRISCLVHFAHPARTDWGKDLVGPEASADSEGHQVVRILSARRRRGGFAGSIQTHARHTPTFQWSGKCFWWSFLIDYRTAIRERLFALLPFRV
jgi:hypothetical protein